MGVRASSGQQFEDDFLLRESVSAADPRTARRIFEDFESQASYYNFDVDLHKLHLMPCQLDDTFDASRQTQLLKENEVRLSDPKLLGGRFKFDA